MSPAEKKRNERLVFELFVDTAMLPIERPSVLQPDPPAPDIICRLAGQEHGYELTMLTDESIERQFNTGMIRYTNFKITVPDVVERIMRKSEKSYSIESVDLLIHESFTPIDDLWLYEQAKVNREIQSVVDVSCFEKVWIFDVTAKLLREYSRAQSTCS